MSKGYRLITSEEYCSEHNNKADEEKLLVEPGVVYIVDDHDRIQTVIDEPWATDANGAKIETRFTIDGPSLIQHVDFANDSVFPIIADPNPHPNKTRTLYLTKNQVRKWRNKSENSFAGQSVEYVVSGLIGLVNTPAGLASGAIFLVGNQYLSIKKHSFNV